MFLSKLFYILFICSIINSESQEDDICQTDSVNLSCDLTPTLRDESIENKRKYCDEIVNFLKCLNITLRKLSCKNINKNRYQKEISSHEKTQRQISFYNELFEINCERLNKVSKSVRQTSQKQNGNFKKTFNEQSLNTETDTILDECKNNKCESRSLHITCGFPAANPSSNLNAYCNELKHYIHCAKCKTLNCNSETSIVSIRRHLATQDTNYNRKCSAYHSTSSTTAASATGNMIIPSFITPQRAKTTTIAYVTNPKTTLSTTTRLTTSPTSTTTTSSTTSTITGTTAVTITFTTPITTTTMEPTTTSSSTIATTSTTSSTTSSSTSTTTTSTTTSTLESTSILVSITIHITETLSFTTTPLASDTTIIFTATTFISKTDDVFKQTHANDIEYTDLTSKIFEEKPSPSPSPTTSIDTITTITTSTIPTTSFTTQPTDIPTQFKIEPETTSSNEVFESKTDTFLGTTAAILEKNVNMEKFSDSIALPLIDAMTPNSNQSHKIKSLLINFDHIDSQRNVMEAISDGRIFPIKIINRTDIFKGIRNGAVYLHSKTGFILNLNENSNDLCLTSSLTNLNNTNNLTKMNELAKTDCSNGWSVLFWIKVSNLIFFDKTIIKIDNLNDFSNTNRINKNSKFFILKLSNFDVKIQFLFKRKLWTINQNIIWKSDWTMISLIWNEFEGLTLYLNDKKIICQQSYEYQKEFNNKNDNLFPMENSYQTVTQSESGNIYIGFNNILKRNNKKLYWTYRDDSSSHQNLLLASSFTEAVLIDELIIKDHRIDSKEILKYYLKEYSIRNEYDSVEETMYVKSTDSKQSEIVPAKGSFVKKLKDNWFLNINGDKQIVILPNIFDACVQDIDNLCHFGFTANLWVKFTYNFVQNPILDKFGFEQVLFYIGSQDFKHGLEAKLTIYSKANNNEILYSYLMVLNYKTPSYTLTKSYKLFIENIAQINELNCITVQFSDSKNLKQNLKLNWLNINSIEIDSLTTVKLTEQNSLFQLNDYGIKSSVLSNSNSIGLFGDLNKESFLSIKNFEFKNYEATANEIEYDFKSANPTIYELNSLDLSNFNVIGSPQLVDTIYGRSILFSRHDQKLVVKKTSFKCFGNLDLCKNGYTLKIWTCFTNFNLMKISQIKSSYNQFNLTKNMTKKIYLLQNGQKDSRQGLVIYYDVNKNQLITIAKTSSKWYKLEVSLKVKLFAWYVITVSWDERDGLRLYINNKLLDHSSGYNYPFRVFKLENENYDFNLGKSDNEFDEFPGSEPMNSFETLNIETNQTEDKDKMGKNLNKKMNSLVNNYYYEFIIHKIVQYDVRKYPDEIISKSVVFQEKRLIKSEEEIDWLLLTTISSLVSAAIIIIAVLITFFKRRTSNGFWSRENEMSNKKTTRTSRLCGFLGFNENDSIDSTIYSDLELKQCHLNKDINCLLFNSNTNDRLISDEYSTNNSLFGTIDRLIVKNQIDDCSSPSSSTTCSSSSLPDTKISSSQSTFFSSAIDPAKMVSASTSYFVNQQDDSFDKGEIHF